MQLHELDELKIGDVVKLHSGGPSMTVTGYPTAADTVHCEWFDSAGNHYRREFHQDALDLCQKPQEAPQHTKD
jgi:uncharacterized protein YodC (DUF2158 family)